MHPLCRRTRTKHEIIQHTKVETGPRRTVRTLQIFYKEANRKLITADITRRLSVLPPRPLLAQYARYERHEITRNIGVHLYFTRR